MSDHPDGFYRARICERGHLVEDSIGIGAGRLAELTAERGRGSDKFCEDCGASVLTACQECSTDLRGARIGVYGMPMRPVKIAAFCRGCSLPYPWTRRALDAITEIAREEGGLDEAEAEALVLSVQVLAAEGEPTAETALAASRFRRIVAKIGGTAGAAIQQVAVQVVSAAMKQSLGLP